MAAILWRILIAVVCVLLVNALIPPVLHIIGLDVTGDVLTVVRICVAGLAFFYIIKGPPVPWAT